MFLSTESNPSKTVSACAWLHCSEGSSVNLVKVWPQNGSEFGKTLDKTGYIKKTG